MSKFKTIALIARQHRTGVSETLASVFHHLEEKKLNVIVEENSAKLITELKTTTAPYHDLGKNADLIIVIGGDGSLLNAAKTAVLHDVPILGINRGQLGFLTDINPDDATQKIDEVLAGKFTEERRFFLEATHHGLALNDVVLLPGKDAARLIEFDIYINKTFVCSQRSDGLIVSTPTGSTAYALSGGGPIIHPRLEAIALVPMLPHTLSMRPIVVSADSHIEIIIANDSETHPHISCDGQPPAPISAGGKITIQKSAKSLRLIHPSNYEYFHTLREKLHWSTPLC